MTKKFFIFYFAVFVSYAQLAAQNLTPQEYVARYKDLAIREMKRMGVPAAITLAQGLLETESGNSVLLRKSNNHFGIKCKSSWTGTGVSHDDDAAGECFRNYKDAEASYRDHSNFLRGSERYVSLFSLNPTDYKGWARGLKAAGYATNPKYPDILIKHIEQYNLQQYSLEAANDVPKFDASQFEDDKEVNVNEVLAKEEKENQMLSNGNETIQPVAGGLALVNGIRCLFAKKGISLLAISTEKNISLSKLLEYNDLQKDGLLEKDQIIFLQKKSRTGEKEFCIAAKGETIYDIAQNNGIQLQSLMEYNQFSSLAPPGEGKRIYLKPVAVKSIISTVAEEQANNITHEVQPKEGLYSIAKRYSVSIQQIKDWNKLSSDTLSIGQHLIIAK
jgi:LysM repeat protein